MRKYENGPTTIAYASLVSRKTFRFALIFSVLNILQVKAADIMNAYFTASITENIWTVLGPDFGADAQKKAIVVRALYVLNSSGSAFCNHLSDCICHM